MGIFAFQTSLTRIVQGGNGKEVGSCFHQKHTKQVSARRKKNWEQAEQTVDSDDGMPMLTEDSADDDSDASDANSSVSDFDSEEEFSYRKKVGP